MTQEQALAYFKENHCIYGVVMSNFYGRWICKGCYRFDDFGEALDWLDIKINNGYGELVREHIAFGYKDKDKIKTITAKEFMQIYDFD